MRLTIVILVIFAAAGVWRGVHQSRVAAEWERKAVSLRAAAVELSQLQTENAALRALSVDTNELDQLRRDRSELLHLRGRIGVLRRSAAATPAEMRTQIQASTAQTEALLREHAMLQAETDAKERSKQVQRTLGQYAMILSHCATINTNLPLPMSWVEVAARLQEPSQSNYLAIFESLDRGSVKAESIEIVRWVLHPINPMGNAPVLRERQPRRQPDGRWARAYAFDHGAVAELTSNDTNFAEAERERFGILRQAY